MQDELLYLDQKRVMLKYLLPLSEIVVDFYDQVKSISSGYARYGYPSCNTSKFTLGPANYFLSIVSTMKIVAIEIVH